MKKISNLEKHNKKKPKFPSPSKCSPVEWATFTREFAIWSAEDDRLNIEAIKPLLNLKDPFAPSGRKLSA